MRTGGRRLLERDDALGALGQAIDGLGAGRGACLFICADAGLGKTALLDLARRRAPPGVRVARGRGSAMDRDVPFGVAAQVLEPLGGARLAEPGAGAAEARAGVLGRAKHWLEDAASKVPVLLVLDDLHWSDPDSLVVVSMLARLARALPVVVVGGSRPWPPEAAETGRGLVAEGEATLITLAPLSRPASDVMMETLLGWRPSEAASGRAWAFTAGNPYLIEEVAGLIRAQGDLPATGAERLRLTDVLVLSRLAGLPQPALRCAQAAAVLGTEFRLGLVGPVAGLAPEAAGEALDLLFEADLVRQSRPDWAEFAHALVRQAVYDDLLPGRRATLHRRAFDRLADLDELPAAARHAIAGDLVTEPRAVSVVEAAGRASLAAGAVQAAVELFRAAIGLAGPGGGRHLHVLAGDALLAAGRPGEAADAFRAGLADPDIEEKTRARLYRSLALAVAYTGDLPSSEALNRTALELARRVDPGTVPALLVEAVHPRWQGEGPRGAGGLLDRLAAEEPLPTDPAFEAARLFITYCATGDRSVLHALAPVAREPGADLLSPFEPRLVYACVARWEEQLDEDDRVLDVAEEAARERGVLRALFALALARADNRLLRGRPGDALALLGEVERDLPIEPLMAPAVAVTLAAALYQLGRLDEAEARLRMSGSAATMWLVDLHLRNVRARILSARGRVADACEEYRDIEALVERLGVEAPLVCPWASGAVAAYLVSERCQDVVRVCERLEAHSDGLGTWPRMIAAAGRAGVAAKDGDHERAETLYRAAVGLDSGLTLERAAVLVAYADWLRGVGRHREARPWYSEALRDAESGGAERLAARAHAGLRAAGGRRSRAPAVPGQLSEQERRVATLAADGLTTGEIASRLYISPKTVETHLGSVYAKLGVSSKRQLRGRTFEGTGADGPGGGAWLGTRESP